MSGFRPRLHSCGRRPPGRGNAVGLEGTRPDRPNTCVRRITAIIVCGLAHLVLQASPLPAQETVPVDPVPGIEEALDEALDRAALGLVERALEREPARAAILRLGLEAALNVGEHDQAERWSTAWMAAAPEDPRARRTRARVLAVRGRVDEALTVLQPLFAATDALPDDRPAFDFPAAALAAELHRSRGRDVETERLYDRMVSESQRVVLREPADLVALSWAYRFFKDPKLAERTLYKEVQEVFPGNLEAALALGETYLNGLHLPGDARNEFRDALELRPGLAAAWWGQSRAYADWERGEDAARALRRTLDINPRHPGALLARARQKLDDGARDAAREDLRAVLALNPQHPGALALEAALTYLEQGPAAGRAALEAVLEVDPTHGEAWRIVADVLNQHRRWAEALELMRRGVEVDPADPALQDDLARYAFFLGRDDEGDAALRAADESEAFATVWRRNMRMLQQNIRRFYVDAASERILHRFHEQQAGVLEPWVLPLAETFLDDLSARYGFVPEGIPEREGRLLVDHYRRHVDFSIRVLGFSNIGALGVCFGPFIALDSPEAQHHSWARTLLHEMAHTMTLELSKGRVPRWLTEGLSTYEEMRHDPSWDRRLDRELFDAWHADALLPVRHFDAAFSTPRVIYAYFQAGLASQYLVERFGWDKVLAMLRAYGEDRGTEEVFSSVLGLAPEEFDAGFREWVAARIKPIALRPRVDGEALSALETRAREHPDDAEALVALAVALVQRGQALDAQETVGRARGLGSKDPRLDLVAGMVAFGAGDMDRARASLEAALAAGLEDHEAHMMLGRIFLTRGEGEQAAEQFRRARDTFPNRSGDEDPRLKLAELATAAGRTDEALQHLEDHLAHDFEDVAIRKRLVGHYLRTGDVAGARRHLEALLLVVPQDPEVHRDLGPLLLAAGETDAAFQSLEAALTLDLTEQPALEADLRVLLGRALLEARDDRAGARREAQLALTLVPDHAEARRLLEVASRVGGTGEDR